MKKTGDKMRPSVLGHAFLGLTMICICMGLTFSQETRITATVDRTEISEQDQLQLTVEVSGEGSTSVKNIDLRSLKNLRLVAGPSVSTRFQWINGVSSSSKGFTYVLIPQGVGEAEVPAISVTVNDKVYSTEPIKITVTKGTGIKKEKRERPFPPDRFGRLPKREKTEAEVFVQATVDKKKLYRGESLLLTYKAYSTELIIDVDAREMPSFEGFWEENIKVDPNPRIVQMNGKKYYEYTLIKKLLFPSTPAKKIIDSLTFAISIRERSRDFFEDFFGRDVQKVYRKTEPISLEVVDLPEKGRPQNFSGVVGDFSLKKEVDKNECSVNDAVHVKITLEGYGNLRGLQPLSFERATDFKIYEPEVSESSRVEGKKLKSRKIWKYIFVPLTPGEHEIPAINFSYFNPDKGIFESRRTDPQPLLVKKGPQSDQPSITASVPKGEIKPLRTDIHFIKPLKGEVRDRGKFLYKRGWFYILFILPFLFAPSLIGLSMRREKIKNNIGIVRVRKAYANASKGLRRANRLLKKGDVSSTLQEISKSMAGYIADKFNLSPSGLTYEKMEEILEAHQVPEEKIRNFRLALERCDFTRFSKSSMDASKIEQLLQEAQRSILALDTTL